MTMIAISLGAPFWFDALNKVMVVRATAKPKKRVPTSRRSIAIAVGAEAKLFALAGAGSVTGPALCRA
jgi:hypothetical protein